LHLLYQTSDGAQVSDDPIQESLKSSFSVSY
jgi:hypothetical protein